MGLNFFIIIFNEIMTFSSKTASHLSCDPLFSCMVTLYILILLYFPHALCNSLCPVLILTALLLLFLLRLGAIQRLPKTPEPEILETENTIQTEEIIQNHGGIADKAGYLTEVDKWVARQCNPDYEDSFVEWNVKAPLEVIYEAYEGEEDDEDHNGIELHRDLDPTRFRALDRYLSLSMYYPESDSDTSSECDYPMDGLWGSPESGCFRWEEEDGEGLLIEIALDRNEKKDTSLDSEFHVEEENFIEIDISPPKTTPSGDSD